MTVQPRPHRLAVLIDGENVSADIVGGLFAEIEKSGNAIVRRIYGDFSGTGLKKWASQLAKYAIQPRQQFPYTKKKNATDIALVIDVMDLLSKENLDGIWIVSSDSDFTGLAVRIREEGLDVIGVGEEKKAPSSFRNACRRFISMEILSGKLPKIASLASTKSASIENPNKSFRIMSPIFKDLSKDKGYCMYADFKAQLNEKHPEFDVTIYGKKSLGDLLRATGQFEVDDTSGREARISRKIKPTAAAPSAKKSGK